MTTDQPRLRMFAGPNGSGKTTIKLGLDRPGAWFGMYINPDDLERSIQTNSTVSIAQFGLNFSTDELKQFFKESSFLQSIGLADTACVAVNCEAGHISFPGIEMNSYHASVLADFLRRQALKQQKSFSFETVMSAPDKIDLLREAQEQGFRTYLYYVATEDPLINIARVKHRVSKGGHDVPVDKIVARYFRSLKLLPEAVRFSNRAFFFDTSEEEPWYFGTVTDGERLDLESNEIPAWFEATLLMLDLVP